MLHEQSTMPMNEDDEIDLDLDSINLDEDDEIDFT